MLGLLLVRKKKKRERERERERNGQGDLFSGENSFWLCCMGLWRLLGTIKG
jgi:hypothetical protein